MNYWIEPAVDGGLGPGVDYDVTRQPSLVGMLAYTFDDWTGDDIVETAGFWLVTERLARALTEQQVTGWRSEPVAVSTSDMWAQFELLGRKMPELPPWVRLLPIGNETDDIYVQERVFLCVSDRALTVMRQFGFEHARVRDLSEVPPRPRE